MSDKRFSNLCPACGRQHLPEAMVSEAVSDLQRRWGMSLRDVFAELNCGELGGLEGGEIMYRLQQAATSKQQREGLQ